MASTNTDLASRITDFTTDIASLKQNITDSLIVGNSMYGPYGQSTIISEVNLRTSELKNKKKTLEDKQKALDGIINRSNRDFTDLRDTLPETIPTSRFNFLEDYTLVLLCISYLFMIIVALHTYVLYSEESWVTALLRGLLYSILLTLLSGMILYYIA
jgi:hypothetical protein